MTTSVYPGGVDDFGASTIDPGDMHTPLSHVEWTRQASDALQKIETDLVAAADGAGSLANRLAGLIGGGGSSDPLVLTVASDVHAGDTFVDVEEFPMSSLSGMKDVAFFVQGWSTSCERLDVKSISGHRLTLGSLTDNPASNTPSPVRMDHPAGSRIFVVPVGTGIHVALYGAKGDRGRTAVDHAACLRCFLECNGDVIWGNGQGTWKSLTIDHPIAIFDEGRYKQFEFSFGSDTLIWDANTVQSNVPVNPTGNNACIVHAESGGEIISANTTTDTLTIATALSITNGNPIMFLCPYGETLPGGLVAGRQYVIKSYNSTTGALVLAECATPTLTLNITSAGTGGGGGTTVGYWFSNYGSHKHLQLDGLRADGLNGSTGMDGMYLGNTNQPTITKDVYILMQGDGTTSQTQYGVVIDGQLSDNINHVGSQGSYSHYISGTKHTFDLITNNGGPGIKMTGHAHKISQLYSELPTQGIEFLANTTGVRIDYIRWQPGPNTTLIKDHVGNGAGTNSWSVGRITCSGAAANALIADVTGAAPMYLNPGTGLENGNRCTNEALECGGITKFGTFGGVRIEGREARYWNNGGTFKTAQCYDTISWSGAGTLELPDYTGMPGMTFKAHKSDSSGTWTLKQAGGLTTVDSFSAAGLHEYVWMQDGSGLAAWVKAY